MFQCCSFDCNVSKPFISLSRLYFTVVLLSNYITTFFDCLIRRLQEGPEDQTETLALRCDDTIWKIHEYLPQPNAQTALNSVCIVLILLAALQGERGRPGMPGQKGDIGAMVGERDRPQHMNTTTLHLFGFIQQAWLGIDSANWIFPPSVLQGSMGDPGPVGYTGMKVECTQVNMGFFRQECKLKGGFLNVNQTRR